MSVSTTKFPSSLPLSPPLGQHPEKRDSPFLGRPCRKSPVFSWCWPVAALLFFLAACVSPDPNMLDWRCEKESDCGTARDYICAKGRCAFLCVADSNCLDEEYCEKGFCRRRCQSGKKRPCFPQEKGCVAAARGAYRCQGACQAGQQTCTGGRWGSCKGAVVPQKESCNGKDDNCDGSIDEGLPYQCFVRGEPCSQGETSRCYEGPAKTATEGICQPGSRPCIEQDGRWQWGECKGQVMPESKESCDDGLDNNCNGEVDEQCACREGKTSACYPGPRQTHGVGLCRSGINLCTCVQRGVDGSCLHATWGGCKGAIRPQPEICNGVDDDCDGQTDEECQKCQPQTEICNGKDDDCDGSVDEECKKCQPQSEACNGLDDDCDGSVDNISGSKTPLEENCYSGPRGTEGVGICKVGIQTCSGGGVWGPCTGQVLPSKEVCNAKDNDCNGLIDDGLSTLCPDAEARIQAGSFTMGSPPSEKGHNSREAPQHQVTLTHSFAMFRYEITQKFFSNIFGYTPSGSSAPCDTCPVSNVNWHEAAAFASLISQAQGLPSCYTCTPTPRKSSTAYSGTCAVKAAYSGNGGKDYYTCKGYRLPTEAEWEYAARAGTTTATYKGNLTQTGCHKDPNLSPIAWYCLYTPQKSRPVGGKTANSLGLFDMLGNVWEMTYDSWPSPYSSTAVTNPISSPSSTAVLRGGAWNSNAELCRAANRNPLSKTTSKNNIGFRLCRTF